MLSNCTFCHRPQGRNTIIIAKKNNNNYITEIKYTACGNNNGIIYSGVYRPWTQSKLSNGFRRPTGSPVFQRLARPGNEREYPRHYSLCQCRNLCGGNCREQLTGVASSSVTSIVYMTFRFFWSQNLLYTSLLLTKLSLSFPSPM